MFLDPHLNWGWGWRSLTGLSPSVKYFTDRSKAVLLLWIFYVFVLSCVCYVFVRICLYVLCGHLLGKGSWLSFLVSKCDFVTFPLVSWVRCGTYFVSIPDLCTLTYLNVSIFFIFCASSFKCNNYGTVYIVGFQWFLKHVFLAFWICFLILYNLFSWSYKLIAY